MPDPARTPTHTVTVQTDALDRVLIVEAQPEGWAQVLHSYINEIAPTIPAVAAHLFMLQVFQHRDRFSGCTPPIPDALMAQRIQKTTQSVRDARRLLLEHPLRPLAHLGSGVYEPMPGRVWAGRPVNRQGGAPPSTLGTAAKQALQTQSTLGDASSERALAPEPPNQKKKRNEPEPDQGTEAQGLGDCAGTSGVGGAGRADSGARRRVPAVAPTGDLFGLSRTVRLRAALEACGINEPARSVLMDLADLSADEVLACSKQVMPDQSIENPAVVIAHRLLKRRGMTLPKGVKKNNRFSDESFAVIRGLQLAQSRARGEA